MAVRTITAGPRSGGGTNGSSYFVARCLLPEDAEIGNDVLDHWYNFAVSAVLSRWHIQAKQAPPADVVIDVLVSTDGGSTWASIFPSGEANKIVLPAGQTEADGSDFDTASFSVDDKLRVDIVSWAGDAVEFYLSGSAS